MQLPAFLIDHLALDHAATALLRLLPPEAAHMAAMWLLRTTPAPGRPATPSLARTVAGLDFANPLGIAAGFDKEARVFERALAWGFGFVEVGTATPRPQAGNPRPRLFRLRHDRAIVNRFGFNNPGHDAIRRRLEARRPGLGVVGVNIGCNKDTADPASDFVKGVEAFRDCADYLTVNVSSPNTAGLRAWQHGERLERLLDRVLDARARGRRIPILLKLAPDLDDRELADVVDTIARSTVDGLLYSNTTVARPTTLRSRNAQQSGGLSGRPLRQGTVARLPAIRARLRPEQALIAMGGIGSASEVRSDLAAGADLVQLYSALIYAGLGLGRRILADLAARAGD